MESPEARDVIDNLLEQMGVGENEEKAVFIDVIPACHRYESESKPVWEVNGIGDTYAERLTSVGVTTTHILADTSIETLANITEASTSRVKDWVNQVPQADLYDNDDVWMRVMVVTGGADIDTILSFIDSITGVEDPFDGDTVRFYPKTDLPENKPLQTNPDTLHREELETITDGIQEHFDVPISQTPYGVLTSSHNNQK